MRKSEHREWHGLYSEKYSIQTEPSGARIYIQDSYVGESPIMGEIKDIKFIMRGTGYSSVGKSRRSRGATKWTGKMNLVGGNIHTYKIKAVKEGYKPEEIHIEINLDDAVFAQKLNKSMGNYDGMFQNNKYQGARNILITLYPQPQRKK